MVVFYELFGRKVGSHTLAIATLGTAFVGSWLATRGKDKVESGPPINATSKDEENFIQQFIKEAEAEGAKAKH